MYQFQPIGYVYDGAVYCPDCAAPIHNDRHHPIFSDSESDWPEHCAQCHEFLGGTLTIDGMKHLREDLVAGYIRPARANEYMAHYGFDDVFWHVIGTHYGHFTVLYKSFINE